MVVDPQIRIASASWFTWTELVMVALCVVIEDRSERVIEPLRVVLINPLSGEERQIDGSDFWRSASIASQYNGRYGTDRLVGMIRGLIAKPQSGVAAAELHIPGGDSQTNPDFARSLAN